MTKVHAELVGDKAVVNKSDLDRLVELARRTEEIEVLQTDGLDTALLQLAEKGAAFDFWEEAAEAIYSPVDGQPL